jgi:hypothetical protein
MTRRLAAIGLSVILLCGTAISASAKGGSSSAGGCGRSGGRAGGAGLAGANGRVPTGTYFCQPGVCQTSAAVRPPP